MKTDKRLNRKNGIHIALIGMSGSGKSHWSMKLEEVGFKRFCCDDMITARLGHELKRADGSIMDLAEWMGFPYEPGYPIHEARYLSCEIEVMREIIHYIESKENSPGENIVIDTTGSVIYTGEAVLGQLRQLTTILYLNSPPEVHAQMLRNYVSNPRPVLWRQFFNILPGEIHKKSLARCYPLLLSDRISQYRRLAHVTLDCYWPNEDNFGLEDLLEKIRK